MAAHRFACQGLELLKGRAFTSATFPATMRNRRLVEALMSRMSKSE
jgi:hypothetical protein